jgi:hypothetical protein
MSPSYMEVFRLILVTIKKITLKHHKIKQEAGFKAKVCVKFVNESLKCILSAEKIHNL